MGQGSYSSYVASQIQQSRIKNLSSNLSFFLVNATDSELRESRIWLKTLCKLHKQLPPFGAKICTGICPRTNT